MHDVSVCVYVCVCCLLSRSSTAPTVPNWNCSLLIRCSKSTITVHTLTLSHRHTHSHTAAMFSPHSLSRSLAPFAGNANAIAIFCCVCDATSSAKLSACSPCSLFSLFLLLLLLTFQSHCQYVGAALAAVAADVAVAAAASELLIINILCTRLR